MQPYPAYKASGLEWLGEIPVHWEKRKLKQICYMKGRIGWQGLKQAEFTDEGPYLITGMNFKDGVIRWHEVYHITEERYNEAPEIQLKVGDVLMTKDGTIGKLLYVDQLPGKASLNSHLLVLRPLYNDFLAQYLYYQLHSELFQSHIEIHKTGTTFYGITQEAVGIYKMLLPPLPEQEAIIQFIDYKTRLIDTYLTKKQQQVERWQAYRTALMNQAVTKGLNPDAPMKDSGIEWLGDIPAGWEMVPLKFATIQTPDAIKTGPFGSQLLSSEMQGGDVKVYNQRNVIDRNLTQGENYINHEKYEELRAFTVYPGDVLVTTRGTIGRCVLVPDNAELGILHPCLMRIQTNPNKLLAEYLILLIQDSFLIQTQLFQMSNATTIEVIYSGTMRQVLIPVPPLMEQRAIVAYLDEQTAKIDTLIAITQRQIDRLHAYRTALISAAVTGKIDVRGELSVNT